MSAADRLRSLEGPLGSITRIEVEGPMAQAVFILGNALPALIAVVEAAVVLWQDARFRAEQAEARVKELEADLDAERIMRELIAWAFVWFLFWVTWGWWT